MTMMEAISPQGKSVGLVADKDGKLATEPRIVWFPFKGAAAISTTTTFSTKYPNHTGKVVALFVKFSAAPTTSENFTVTLQSVRGDAEYDSVLFSTDPSATSATSIVQLWDIPCPLEMGDEVVVAYTNTDTRTIAGKIGILPVV